MNKLIAIVGMGPGVSLAIARRFAKEGFAVAGIARRADALAEQIETLKATGIRRPEVRLIAAIRLRSRLR